MSIIPTRTPKGLPVYTEQNVHLCTLLEGKESEGFRERLQMEDFACHIPDVSAIFVNSRFSLQSQELVDFVVAHEEGHHMLEHKVVQGLDEVALRRFIQTECEADKYALDVTSKQSGIAAMKYLLSGFENGERSSSDMEGLWFYGSVLLARVSQLKKLVL